MDTSPELKEAARHIYQAFKCLGYDPMEDEGTKATPERVAKYWASVLGSTVMPFNFTTFEAKGTSELVIVKDIEFASLCEHHMLPFFGKAHVGYVPFGKIVGLSKIPRLVDWRGKRPQTQEYLTNEIGKDLSRLLDPVFVGVVMEATHTCVGCRGVGKVGCSTITSFFGGTAPRDVLIETRKEFHQLISR